MKFIVTRPYDDTYVKECLTLWRISSHKAFESARTFAIISVVYVILGLINYLTGRPIPIYISSIALATFMLLVIQVTSIYQSKIKTRKKAAACINKYMGSLNAFTELTFTENSMKYSDPEIMVEVKWIALSHYQIIDEYTIFYLQNENKKPAFSMTNANIPPDMKNDLFALINSKLEHK